MINPNPHGPARIFLSFSSRKPLTETSDRATPQTWMHITPFFPQRKGNVAALRKGAGFVK